MFTIVRNMKRKELIINTTNATAHFHERVERIERVGGNIGKPVAGCIVDKGHANGCEEHILTSAGLIVVINHNTKKAVTVMVARPGQIKRYYRNGKAPQWLIDKTYHNTKELHLNY